MADMSQLEKGRMLLGSIPMKLDEGRSLGSSSKSNSSSKIDTDSSSKSSTGSNSSSKSYTNGSLHLTADQISKDEKSLEEK